MNSSPVGSANGNSPHIPSSPSKDKQNRPYLQWMVTLIGNNPYRELGKGIFSGVVEVYLDQPLVTVKNELQANMGTSHALKFNREFFKKLWAGAGANATGQACVAGANMFTLDYLRRIQTAHGNQQSLTFTQDLFTSIATGILTSPLSCSEMIMMHQNRRVAEAIKNRESKPTYSSTIAHLWKMQNWRMFTKGLGHTAIREAFFTASYGTFSPYFKKKFQEIGIENQLIATILGGGMAGLLGGTCSHPFDTWNTQAKLGVPKTQWLSSYQGLGARNTRIALAIIWYSLINEGYQKMIVEGEKYK